MTVDAEAVDGARQRTPDEDLPKLIERWTAKFQKEPSVEAAQKLLMLRWRAGGWAARTATSDRPNHLAGAPDRDVPKEVHVSELTPELVRAALARHGGIVLRGLIPAAEAEHYVARIDKTIDGFMKATKSKADSVVNDGDYAPLRLPAPDRQKITFHRKCLAVEEVSAMNVDAPILFETLMRHLHASGIVDIAAQVFGEQPVTAVQKTSMRRMPADGEAGWHQDLGAVRDKTKAIALWIPFSACGEDAPGFEFLRCKFDGAVPQMNETLMPWTVTDETAAALRRDTEMLTPNFAPGDAVLFDQFTLHRGATYPHMTKPRWSIDTWLFGPSSLPDHLIPIYV